MKNDCVVVGRRSAQRGLPRHSIHSGQRAAGCVRERAGRDGVDLSLEGQIEAITNASSS